MENWDIDALPNRDQFSYWREVLCQAYVALDPIAANRDSFKGKVTAHRVGELNVTTIRSVRQQIYRGTAQIRKDPAAVYFLNLQVSGRCRMVQGNRAALILPGEFSLVDSTEPYLVDYCSDDWQQYSVRIPRDALYSLLKSPEHSTAIRISRRTGGMSSLAVDFVDSLTRNATMIGAGDGTIARTLADLVALALGATDEGSERSRKSARHALCASITSHIETHLGDPTINPASVAARFRISTRYLHKTLEESGKSFGKLLLERRLEASAEALLRDSQESISSVAFRLGFNDLSHFSRTFRQRFGSSPRDFRQRSQEPDTA